MIRSILDFALLTGRNLFAGKRAWAAAAAVLLPPVAAALVAALAPRADGTELFHGIAFHFSLRILLFLLALLYGLSFTSGEIEEGTAGYLILGALPRWTLVGVQVLVGTLAITAILGGSLFLTGLAASLASKGPPEDLWRDAAGMTVVAGAGALVSLGFYAACGLSFRRPLVVAVIATFLWEILVTPMPVRFAAWTLTNNLRSLLLLLVFDGQRGPWYRYARNYEFPGYGSAALFVSAAAAAFLAAAMVAAMNRSIEGKEAR